MCNLYRLTKPNAEVAKLFSAKLGEVGNAGGGEVYPGYPGIVMANGELRSMAWGFPLVLGGKNDNRSNQSRSTMPAPTSSTTSCGAFPFKSGAA